MMTEKTLVKTQTWVGVASFPTLALLCHYCLRQQLIVHLTRSRVFQGAHINVIDHCQLLCFLQRQITVHWWISLSFSSQGFFCFHYFLSVFFSPITCLLYCTQSLESDKLRNWIKVSIKARLLWALTSELVRLEQYRMKPEEDISLPER